MIPATPVISATPVIPVTPVISVTPVIPATPEPSAGPVISPRGLADLPSLQKTFSAPSAFLGEPSMTQQLIHRDPVKIYIPPALSLTFAWITILLLLFSVGCEKAGTLEEAPADAKAPEINLDKRVTYSPLSAAETQTLLTLPAQVVLPPHALRALAPPVEGRLVQWKVAPGQHLSPGDPIAEMSGGELLSLKSEINELEGIVKARRRSLSKRKEQVSRGVQTMQGVYEIEVSLAEARAGLSATKKKLASLRSLRGDDTPGEKWLWRSEVQGEVREIECATGSILSPTTTCLTLVDLSEALLRVDLPERHMEKVGATLKATWIPTSQGKGRPGKAMKFVRREPAVHPESRTLSLYFSAEDGADLFPGSTGRAMLTVPLDQVAFRVEKRALTRINGQEVLFIQAEDGARPTPQRVDVIGRDGAALLVRADNLSEGTRVATRGVFLLKSLTMLGEESP